MAYLSTKESVQAKARSRTNDLVLQKDNLARILSGNDPNCKIELKEAVEDGISVHIYNFRFTSVQSRDQATITVAVHADDYDRITRTEVVDKNGKIQVASTRRNHDANGFPFFYKHVELKKNGYVTNTFEVLEWEPNATFSDDEVFRFAPAAAYGVVNTTGGRPTIERFPEGIKPSKIIYPDDPNKPKAISPAKKWSLIAAMSLIFILPAAYVLWNFKKRTAK